MSDEENLEEKKEEGEAVEAKPKAVKEEKKGETEVNTEHKRSDYEYKSWSFGIPVPEGWERCLGYNDVIRRLKAEPPKPEESTPVKTENKDTESQKKPKEGDWEPWGPAQRGSCCR